MSSVTVGMGLSAVGGKSSESVQSMCWRPVTHAQTLASYSAVYRFGTLSQSKSLSCSGSKFQTVGPVTRMPDGGVYYVNGVVRSASNNVRNVVADNWWCLRLERSSLDTAVLLLLRHRCIVTPSLYRTRSAEGGWKPQNGRFPYNIALCLKKICYRVSLCENR